MIVLALALALGAGDPVAVPEEERPAEKLPVDLPELKVIGHETKPDVEAGRKLTPDAPPSVGALRPPPPARATTELLDRLRLPVPMPPDPALNQGPASDRDPYTAVRGGLGTLPLGGLNLGSYDAGLYHGQSFGGVLSATDMSTQYHGLDRWSTLRAGQQFSWTDSTWAALGYRREAQDAGTASALQEGGRAEATFTHEALGFRLDGEVGRVEAAGIPGSGTTSAYGAGARVDFTAPPELWLDDHLIKLGLEIGQYGSSGPGNSGWSSPRIAAGGSDRFYPIDRLAVEAGLGLTLFRQSSYVEPAVRLEWRPGTRAAGPDPEIQESPSEVWAAMRTDTRLPAFEELYQGRQRAVGNAELRPGRIEPRAELGAGHRFSDRFYATGAVALSRALDWIHYAPAGSGLWQPRNFAAWQEVYDVEAQSQYLWTDRSLQRFMVRVRNPAGLGERLFTAGTGHESTWLDGKLVLMLGTSVDYIELGPSQGGGRGVDWRADWEAGYRVAPEWQIFLAGKDWHVAQQEPSEGYFAVPAQVTAGIKYDF